MRQFTYILLAVYLIVGTGTGFVYYSERDKDARREARQDELVVESLLAGMLWPFHIVDVLSGHDARELS